MPTAFVRTRTSFGDRSGMPTSAMTGFSGASKTRAFTSSSSNLFQRAGPRGPHDGFEQCDVVDHVLAGDWIVGLTTNCAGKCPQVIANRFGRRHLADGDRLVLPAFGHDPAVRRLDMGLVAHFDPSLRAEDGETGDEGR